MLEKIRRFGPALGRVLLWRLITALGIDAFHSIPGMPFKMSLEPAFRSVGSLGVFTLGRAYEAGLTALPRFLRPGDTSIDGGANQRIYPLFMASLVGEEGHVIAIEPQPYATRRLQLSAAYNGFRNITIVQAAVSDSPGVAEFHIFDEPVSAGLKKSGGQVVSVETISIDSLVKKAGVAKIAFIKLDVEGAERDVLTGAQNVIKKDRPFILFEALEDPQSTSSQEIWKFLRGFGYRLHIFKNGTLSDVTNQPVRAFDILAYPASDPASVTCETERAA
jgi:FkbM family methyltransferase